MPLPFDDRLVVAGYEAEANERGERLIWIEPLLARQLVRLTVLSAQTSTLDASVD
jgi:hypothetical protein